jgi:hypothetical protein
VGVWLVWDVSVWEFWRGRGMNDTQACLEWMMIWAMRLGCCLDYGLAWISP